MRVIRSVFSAFLLLLLLPLLLFAGLMLHTETKIPIPRDKVKADLWKKATTVRIFADWIT